MIPVSRDFRSYGRMTDDNGLVMFLFYRSLYRDLQTGIQRINIVDLNGAG